MAATRAMDRKIPGESWMNNLVLQDELDRIEVMSTIEAVAYANRLSRRLKCEECVGQEREHTVILLQRLTDIARFLKIA